MKKYIIGIIVVTCCGLCAREEVKRTSILMLDLSDTDVSEQVLDRIFLSPLGPLIEKLDVSGTQIMCFPKSLDRLNNLKELVLARKEMEGGAYLQEHAPDFFKIPFQTVQRLFGKRELLYSDQTRVPRVVVDLTAQHLKTLDDYIETIMHMHLSFALKLGSNRLKPQALEDLCAFESVRMFMRELHLGRNWLNEIPEGFQNLEQLEVLHVPFNNLDGVAIKRLCRFENIRRNLRVLDIAYNRVENDALGPIALLENLEEFTIDMGLNRIKQIPESWDRLEKLKKLRLIMPAKEDPVTLVSEKYALRLDHKNQIGGVYNEAGELVCQLPYLLVGRSLSFYDKLEILLA